MDSLQAFRERVARVTAEAEAHPLRHRLRIAGLALLAYAYLFGILFGLFALTALIVVAALRLHVVAAIKFGIPLLVLDWIVLRSLWVRLEPPDGRVLGRDEAPALHAEIERVRSALGVERLHRVLLVDDLNAAIVQHPRLGVFGLHQNYLLLGLPLLQALSPAQFTAVLAHEFGHLSGNHGRFGTWIYRVRRTWGQLLASLEEKGSGWSVVRWFFDWFAPRFSAATFVLARQQEYEADRRAAELTDARTAAATLVRLRLVSRQLDEDFWPAIDRRLALEPEPPEDMLAAQARLLAGGLDAARGRAWAAQAMLAPTDVDDTHPSLADRLRALDVPEAGAIEAALAPAVPSAAEHLFGGALATLRAGFDAAWRETAREAWASGHGERTKDAARLAALRERDAAGEALPDEERWELASLTLALEGAATGTPLVESFSVAHPRHAMALWTRGRLALERGDEGGLASIEAAIAIDDEATPAACATAYAWLHERGRVAEADRWHERGERFQQEAALASEERSTVRPDDSFIGAGLDPPAAEALREWFRSLPEAQAVWLVRKRVVHRPGAPAFVCVVRPIPEVCGRRYAEDRSKVLDRIAGRAPLPPETLILVTNGPDVDLERRLRDQTGPPLYEA